MLIIILGTGTAKKGSLVPTPTPIKNDASIRNFRRLFFKINTIHIS